MTGRRRRLHRETGHGAVMSITAPFDSPSITTLHMKFQWQYCLQLSHSVYRSVDLIYKETKKMDAPKNMNADKRNRSRTVIEYPWQQIWQIWHVSYVFFYDHIERFSPILRAQQFIMSSVEFISCIWLSRSQTNCSQQPGYRVGLTCKCWSNHVTTGNKRNLLMMSVSDKALSCQRPVSVSRPIEINFGKNYYVDEINNKKCDFFYCFCVRLLLIH